MYAPEQPPLQPPASSSASPPPPPQPPPPRPPPPSNPLPVHSSTPRESDRRKDSLSTATATATNPHAATPALDDNPAMNISDIVNQSASSASAINTVIAPTTASTIVPTTVPTGSATAATTAVHAHPNPENEPSTSSTARRPLPDQSRPSPDQERKWERKRGPETERERKRNRQEERNPQPQREQADGQSSRRADDQPSNKTGHDNDGQGSMSAKNSVDSAARTDHSSTTTTATITNVAATVTASINATAAATAAAAATASPRTDDTRTGTEPVESSLSDPRQQIQPQLPSAVAPAAAASPPASASASASTPPTDKTRRATAVTNDKESPRVAASAAPTPATDIDRGVAGQAQPQPQPQPGDHKGHGGGDILDSYRQDLLLSRLVSVDGRYQYRPKGGTGATVATANTAAPNSSGDTGAILMMRTSSLQMPTPKAAPTSAMHHQYQYPHSHPLPLPHPLPPLHRVNRAMVEQHLGPGSGPGGSPAKAQAQGREEGDATAPAVDDQQQQGSQQQRPALWNTAHHQPPQVNAGNNASSATGAGIQSGNNGSVRDSVGGKKGSVTDTASASIKSNNGKDDGGGENGRLKKDSDGQFSRAFYTNQKSRKIESIQTACEAPVYDNENSGTGTGCITDTNSSPLLHPRFHRSNNTNTKFDRPPLPAHDLAHPQVSAPPRHPENCTTTRPLSPPPSSNPPPSQSAMKRRRSPLVTSSDSANAATDSRMRPQPNQPQPQQLHHHHQQQQQQQQQQHHNHHQHIQSTTGPNSRDMPSQQQHYPNLTPPPLPPSLPHYNLATAPQTSATALPYHHHHPNPTYDYGYHSRHHHFPTPTYQPPVPSPAAAAYPEYPSHHPVHLPASSDAASATGMPPTSSSHVGMSTPGAAPPMYHPSSSYPTASTMATPYQYHNFPQQSHARQYPHAYQAGGATTTISGSVDPPVPTPPPPPKDPDEPYPRVYHDFGEVPASCIGDLIQIWDFASTFSEVLRLSPFKLIHLKQAVAHSERTALVDAVITRLVQTTLRDRALISELGIPATVVRSINTAKNTATAVLLALPSIVSFEPEVDDEAEDKDAARLQKAVLKMESVGGRTAFYKALDARERLRVLRELVDYACMSDVIRECVTDTMEHVEEERKKAREEFTASRKRLEASLRDYRDELHEYRLKHGLIEPLQPSNNQISNTQNNNSNNPNDLNSVNNDISNNNNNNNNQNNNNDNNNNNSSTHDGDPSSVDHTDASGADATTCSPSSKNSGGNGSTQTENANSSNNNNINLATMTRQEKMQHAQKMRKQREEQRVIERGLEAILARIEKTRASLKSLKSSRGPGGARGRPRDIDYVQQQQQHIYMQQQQQVAHKSDNAQSQSIEQSSTAIPVTAAPSSECNKDNGTTAATTATITTTTTNNGNNGNIKNTANPTVTSSCMISSSNMTNSNNNNAISHVTSNNNTAVTSASNGASTSGPPPAQMAVLGLTEDAVRSKTMGVDREERTYWFFEGCGLVWVEQTSGEKQGEWAVLKSIEAVRQLIKWLSPDRINERTLKAQLTTRLDTIEYDMKHEVVPFVKVGSDENGCDGDVDDDKNTENVVNNKKTKPDVDVNMNENEDDEDENVNKNENEGSPPNSDDTPMPDQANTDAQWSNNDSNSASNSTDQKKIKEEMVASASDGNPQNGLTSKNNICISSKTGGTKQEPVEVKQEMLLQSSSTNTSGATTRMTRAKRRRSSSRLDSAPDPTDDDSAPEGCVGSGAQANGNSSADNDGQYCMRSGSSKKAKMFKSFLLYRNMLR